jgi:hypothetical protein
LEQVAPAALITALTTDNPEILQHLAAALLCQLCLQVAVEDVITHQVAPQTAVAAVAAEVPAITGSHKLLWRRQQALLGKVTRVVPEHTITVHLQAHTMVVVVAEAQEIWATVEPTEICKAVVAKEWPVV